MIQYTFCQWRIEETVVFINNSFEETAIIAKSSFEETDVFAIFPFEETAYCDKIQLAENY